MPADLFSDDDIQRLADKIDSPAMYKVLCRFGRENVILNDRRIDRQTFDFLQQLAALGLVDLGVDPGDAGKPHHWVSNQNGKKMLRLFASAGQEDEEAPPIDPGKWLP
jgi:hypothetical protein